jgi:hypothetical protein
LEEGSQLPLKRPHGSQFARALMLLKPTGRSSLTWLVSFQSFIFLENNVKIAAMLNEIQVQSVFLDNQALTDEKLIAEFENRNKIANISLCNSLDL